MYHSCKWFRSILFSYMLDYYFTRFSGDFKCDTRAMLNDRVHIWRSYMLLYSWKFLPNSVHCHWLLWGHMTYISNNETVPCQNIWEGNIAKSLMSEGNSAPSQCFPQLCLGKRWDSWETKLAVFPGFSFLSVYCQAIIMNLDLFITVKIGPFYWLYMLLHVKFSH